MPVVRSSDAESATVTQSLRPSNVSAPPARPAVVRVAPEIVPGLPAPDASVAVGPDTSSKPYAATSPAEGGGGSLTVNVTGTVFGDPLTPAAVTVTVALWVPAARPAGFAVTVTAWGAEPLAGATDSHAASSDAVKLSVPPPVFVTSIVLPAGALPPTVAANASDAGDTASAGGGGCALTVSVTGTVAGEPCAPAAVTVTVAL